MNQRKGLVFISCGQRTEEEKKLGQEIVQIVRDLTPYEPYFAEFQQSLDGLTTNIFGSLNRMVGFITVMHKRGEVSIDGTIQHSRGSVWIEQEIAIASFLVQCLSRKVSVLSFMEEDIPLEGVRQLITMNPVRFTTNEDIIAHLGKMLPSWQLEPKSGGDAEVELTYQLEKGLPGEHLYEMLVNVTNTTSRIIKHWVVDLEIPKPVLLDTNYGPAVPDRETDTHKFFRQDSKGVDSLCIHRGDTRTLINIHYHIDTHIFHSRINSMALGFHSQNAFQQKAIAKVYLDEDDPIVIEKPIQELQQF